MELSLKLVLPRDELSIPVVRRILVRAMDVLGVEPECRDDIGVAITEASTNVLDHAHGEREYEVTCSVDDNWCRLRVVDRGGGFDAAGVAVPPGEAEGGRGILLMRSLVDRVHFEARAESGTVVVLEKRLAFAAGSPGARLTGS